METPGYILLSHQTAMKQQMDLLANNLANMNTTGFKGEKMLFVELLEKTEDGKSLSFVQSQAVVRDLQQGPMLLSGNSLDVAIRGEGYFVIEAPAGERYTRAGAFSLDADGQIVTLAGYPVLGAGNSPITLPSDVSSITIARDGTVSSEQGEHGRIQLVTFENPQMLTKIANGLFDPGEEEPQRVAEPEIEQGMIEGSNVNGMAEMTTMIKTLRSYQAAARLIEDEHKRQRQAIEALVAT